MTAERREEGPTHSFIGPSDSVLYSGTALLSTRTQIASSPRRLQVATMSASSASDQSERMERAIFERTAASGPSFAVWNSHRALLRLRSLARSRVLLLDRRHLRHEQPLLSHDPFRARSSRPSHRLFRPPDRVRFPRELPQDPSARSAPRASASTEKYRRWSRQPVDEEPRDELASPAHPSDRSAEPVPSSHHPFRHWHSRQARSEPHSSRSNRSPLEPPALPASLVEARWVRRSRLVLH